MGELREILYTLNNVRQGRFNERMLGNNNEHSIFKKAAPAILNFPVLVSELVSLEDLTLINKALEREYSTVIRIAMGLDDVIDCTGGGRGRDKVDYIKKFHTGGFTHQFSDPNREIADLFESINKENLIVSEETVLTPYTKSELIAEELGLNMDNLNNKTILNELTKIRGDQLEVQYDRRDYSKTLVDNDVKKANELLPTTLDITVYQQLSGEVVIEDHILLGIKCTSHKIPSEVLLENIRSVIDNGKSFFRFIQWTTGEIKFFKDYLLCLDTLKKEALQTRSKNKESIAWFRELKNRATLSRIRSALNLREGLIPNASIIITMDEIDQLRNVYGIDLLNDVNLVKKIMSKLFLIGFIIVDSGSEIVYFLFDAFQQYHTYSFNALERENRNVANDVKAITSLMSKF